MVEDDGKKESMKRQAPQLVAVLKEMTDGLDNVRTKVDALSEKVKAGHFPRKEGISYLEAKHLLLLNYCQSLVYYLLRKAKGLSIEGHPVVKSLVEIRLFLEKIRPIDKKLEYQIKKLTGVSVTRNLVENPDSVEKESDTKNKDLLKYRPNPELLLPKTNVPQEGAVGAYRPPKFAPAEDKISRQERNAKRMEEKNVRLSRESDYVRELIDDIEGKPEEVREVIGGESREHRRFVARLEKRAREEEEVFNRAPLPKAERNKLKQLKKSRNGLLDLTENFYDEIRSLPTEGGPPEVSTSMGSSSNKAKKFKRRRPEGYLHKKRPVPKLTKRKMEKVGSLETLCPRKIDYREFQWHFATYNIREREEMKQGHMETINRKMMSGSGTRSLDVDDIEVGRTE